MDVIPNNATLDYFKVCDMIRRHLNAVMTKANELRAAQYTGLSEANRQKSLTRIEVCRDTLAGILDELNSKYWELRPSSAL